MSPPGDCVLELRELRKRYGSLPVLEGLDLRLERGQVYGFLGRNGAGKSTTLRIVMGITHADAGSVRLFGSPVAPGDVRPRQRVGYVAQEQHFYDWMTPEALGKFVGAFYPSWDADRYAELLERFEIPERRLRTFSGGMHVKQALALALAHRPELLVLDEPTAGLDPVVRREFLEILREIVARGEQATLFSSHLVDEVELVATRVGIVERGVMRYEGSLAELAGRVRRLTLPGAGADSGAAGSDVRAALAALPLRTLSRRGTPPELTLWSDDPAVFAALEARLPGARYTALTLEEIFIELVRSGPGTHA